MEPVVADCVIVVAFGSVSENVTLAPDAGEPPFVTAAVIGTRPGGTKLAPEIETLTASEGGVNTVALAVSVVLNVEFVASMFTA